MRNTSKLARRIAIALAAALVVVNVAAIRVLPPLLLDAPTRARSDEQRRAIRDALAEDGSWWSDHEIAGGEGAPLTLHWLHRHEPRGVVIMLHGFRDDGWGPASRAAALPSWDAVVFTFRGRDLHPSLPNTLGGWETDDALAAVAFVESRGVARGRIVLSGASQGAAVALLALERLEQHGALLGGALLESPFRDLPEAVHDHVRGTVGPLEWLVRPGERLSMWAAGRRAHFDPLAVSPLDASHHVRTPVAIVTGDADRITPLDGVREIAAQLSDLTVVAGAGHMHAADAVPGGWSSWAHDRLRRWHLEQ
jgi:predicted esterase